MRRMVFSSFKGIGVISLLLVFSIVATAQFRAGMQGTVSDSNGAGVPGATVTLVNKSTNQTQSTVTNGDGFYRFSTLTPGNYSVTVEKQDFSKAQVSDIVVEAEAVKGQDVVLQAGTFQKL